MIENNTHTPQLCKFSYVCIFASIFADCRKESSPYSSTVQILLCMYICLYFCRLQRRIISILLNYANSAMYVYLLLFLQTVEKNRLHTPQLCKFSYVFIFASIFADCRDNHLHTPQLCKFFYVCIFASIFADCREESSPYSSTMQILLCMYICFYFCRLQRSVSREFAQTLQNQLITGGGVSRRGVRAGFQRAQPHKWYYKGKRNITFDDNFFLLHRMSQFFLKKYHPFRS